MKTYTTGERNVSRTTQVERALERLLMSVEALGKIKDGKTLFETSVIESREAHAAWVELHDARQHARALLNCPQ